MIALYRPVGLKELELISQSGFKAFPPRLEWQPIFYPVLNQAYAEQIASEWNTKDAFSGYCGVVTAFDIESDYFSHFEIQTVGDDLHRELWVPSEELPEFNAHIVGEIRVARVFLGEGFTWPEDKELRQKLGFDDV